MHQSTLLLALGSSIAFVTATPRPLLALGAFEVPGVATFNNYNTQKTTVCNKFYADNPKYFGAAIGDISKDISGGQCEGSHVGDQSTGYDTGKCNGQSAAANYGGPACLNPQATTCGLCFKVDNYGDIATQPPATTLLGSATVQIIDACPAGSAYNYCKTETAGNQRCGDGTTNSLDIDEMAYQQLTGTGYNETSHPNLNIRITAVTC